MTAMPKCVTHHYACDCREAKFTDLQKEVERLRNENEELRNALENVSDCLIGGTARDVEIRSFIVEVLAQSPKQKEVEP